MLIDSAQTRSGIPSGPGATSREAILFFASSSSSSATSISSSHSTVQVEKNTPWTRSSPFSQALSAGPRFPHRAPTASLPRALRPGCRRRVQSSWTTPMVRRPRPWREPQRYPATRLPISITSSRSQSGSLTIHPRMTVVVRGWRSAAHLTTHNYAGIGISFPCTVNCILFTFDIYIIYLNFAKVVTISSSSSVTHSSAPYPGQCRCRVTGPHEKVRWVALADVGPPIFPKFSTPDRQT